MRLWFSGLVAGVFLGAVLTVLFLYRGMGEVDYPQIAAFLVVGAALSFVIPRVRNFKF